MRSTRLGGLTVSAQGLGCVGMSEEYGPADWDESIATIGRALDLGVTFLDTADSYGTGHNEVWSAGGSRTGVPRCSWPPSSASTGRRRGVLASVARRARLRQAVLRGLLAPARRRGDRPVLPAPPAADGRDRGDGRRDGRARGRGQGPLPGPVRGQRHAAAPRACGAPDRRGAVRVLAVDPRSGNQRDRRDARARRRPGAVRAARPRLPDRHR